MDQDFFDLVIDSATVLAKVGLIPRLRALVEVRDFINKTLPTIHTPYLTTDHTIFVQAAREVGARSTLSQADLFRLVKAMEKKFISVDERQLIVKELRLRASAETF